MEKQQFKKIKNKTGKNIFENIGVIIIILLFVAMFFLVLQIVINLVIDLVIKDNKEDCLKAIAEDYCKEKGLLFYRLNYVYDRGYEFNCRDEREVILKSFVFTNKEIEGC